MKTMIRLFKFLIKLLVISAILANNNGDNNNNINKRVNSEEKLKKPLIIAHRGASGYLPEHTLAAKVLAFTMGADYIEQDVALTKDNVPIVIHDIYLDQITNVAKVYPNRTRQVIEPNGDITNRYFVIDFTYEEIRKLKVSERFELSDELIQVFPNRFSAWASSFHLHTLQEEIELIKGLEESLNSAKRLNNEPAVKERGLMIEIKRPDFHFNENKKNFSEIILQILTDYGYTKKSDMAAIQCFSPYELRRIRSELKSNLTLIQLVSYGSEVINFNYWNSKEGFTEIATFADGLFFYFQNFFMILF
jgi:glycerophosphoryl diester phosphodiesterase